MAGLLALAGACESGDGGEGTGVLSRLVIAPQNQTIAEGGSLQLNATAIWDTGRSENVTFDVSWSSSDTNVVEFEEARINAVGPGESVIEARYEGLTASTSVFVDASIDEVLISPATITLAEGTSAGASATGIATDGSKRSANTQVAWTSSNQSVASVDGAGNITAEGAGDAVISASQGGTVIGEIDVSVTDAGVSEVAVTADDEEMLVGTAQRLSIVVSFDDDHAQAAPLAWEITSQELDDPEGEGDVVDFSGGAVVALQPGTASFTGTFVIGEDELGTSDEVTVTVVDGTPDSIEVLAPPSVSTEGQTIFLGATGDFGGTTFSIGSLVFWQGSDDTVLRIRGAEATPRSADSVTVNAVWPVDGGDAIVGEATIDVVDTAASGIEIDSSSEALRARALFGSTDQDVTSAALWSSDDDCAFVDNAPARSGNVTLLADSCTATITVEYKGQTDSVDVDQIGAE